MSYHGIMRRYRTGSNLSPVIIIILACVAVFLVGLFSNFDLFFALVPSLWESQPWTLLTNLFVHAGFTHIFFNMLTLYFFGTYLSAIVGDRTFLLIYFGAGLLGNVVYLLFVPVSFIPVVGASGAIFGLGGALTALRPKQQVYVFPIPAPIPLWAAVIGGFVIVSFVPGVAWQAHLGGLAFGLVYGYFLKRGYY